MSSWVPLLVILGVFVVVAVVSLFVPEHGYGLHPQRQRRERQGSSNDQGRLRQSTNAATEPSGR